GLFAGSFVPRLVIEAARRAALARHVLLQWDDEGNDPQALLDPFDAVGCQEQALHANLGGPAGVPQRAADAASRSLTRRLRRGRAAGRSAEGEPGAGSREPGGQ